MRKPKKGKLARLDYCTNSLLVSIPVLALLVTALLNWTMRTFLETNLLLRLLKLVGLPFWIPLVMVAPPLAFAWVVSHIFRRSDAVFAVVFILLLIVWGFWYLIPPMIENWDEFSRFLGDIGAV